jgi:hypothetical protein
LIEKMPVRLDRDFSSLEVAAAAVATAVVVVAEAVEAAPVGVVGVVEVVSALEAAAAADVQVAAWDGGDSMASGVPLVSAAAYLGEAAATVRTNALVLPEAPAVSSHPAGVSAFFDGGVS